MAHVYIFNITDAMRKPWKRAAQQQELIYTVKTDSFGFRDTC